jgi:hypothetical protein
MNLTIVQSIIERKIDRIQSSRGIKNWNGHIYSEFLIDPFLFKFSLQKQILYFNGQGLHRIVAFI